MKTIEQLTSLFITALESKAGHQVINPSNDCEFEATKYAIEVIQNKIKVQAIEEFSDSIAEPMDFRLSFRTLNELLSEYADKLRGEK